VIYLDWNATTPPHPDVIAAMEEARTHAWANPSSVHRPGQRARAELDRARDAVAKLSGMHARDVVLTSGGTEANNLALWHLVDRALVLSPLEHPSVVRTAEALAARGVTVRWVEPLPSGLADVAGFERALRELPSVGLVSLQAVNHETGVVQPVREIAAIAHGCGALLHVDAVQAVGKIDPSWGEADLLTVAAHKIRGPKGIGALAVRPRVKVAPVLRGGAQERGLRPGTQDAVLAAGFAVAAERATQGPTRYAPLARMRDRLERELIAIGAAAHIEVARNGDAPRVPHVTNLSWLGALGPELCAALDLEGVAVSSGSACSAGTAEPSPVVTAMAGIDRARSAVRVSLGEETAAHEIDEAIEAFRRVIARR
jgi:cysteine desulfurase